MFVTKALTISVTMCSKDCESLLSTGWDPPKSCHGRADRRKIVGGVV